MPMLMLTMTACASPSDNKETLTASSAITNESTDSSSTTQVSGNFPEKLNMEIERVSFDAEVIAHSSANKKSKSYEVTVRKFDKEKVKEKLLSNIEVAETINYGDEDSYQGTKEDIKHRTQ